MVDYEKLWKECEAIAKEEAEIYIQPHEKSISKLRREWNVSNEVAQKIIERLMLEGRMSTRIAKSSNGKMTPVYFPIERTS